MIYSKKNLIVFLEDTNWDSLEIVSLSLQLMRITFSTIYKEINLNLLELIYPAYYFKFLFHGKVTASPKYAHIHTIYFPHMRKFANMRCACLIQILTK